MNASIASPPLVLLDRSLAAVTATPAGDTRSTVQATGAPSDQLHSTPDFLFSTIIEAKFSSHVISDT